MRGSAAGRVRRLHGTCVELRGAGVLLLGPPGCGKSDLALRLIDAGARLVADDLVELHRRGRGLIAALPGAVPAALRGRLEVRGVGILPVPARRKSPLRLVVELVRPSEVERLPAPATKRLLGIDVPCLRLAPFEASAAAKLRLVLGRPSGR
jgi:serine kinase of HPr protein (carbohydrate metabolism regulator)